MGGMLSRRLFLGMTPLFSAALAGAPREDDWPRWRGPDDNGMARGDAPLRWSDTQNVAWKIATPGLGHSSPIVWGDRLFLTTAEPVGGAAETGVRQGNFGSRETQPEHRLLVLCYDRNTGKELWRHSPRTVSPHEGYHRRYGSHASNTPVTDGKHLYAWFGSRGLFCYTLDGKLVWQYDPKVRLRMRNAFGEGTPTVLAGDLLLLNYDHEGDSFLLALDKTTGKVRWRVSRDEPSSWAPPLVVTHAGQQQVITSATNKVRAYNLADGGLIWECGGLGTNAIPAPVVADGTVYVMTGHRDPNLLAIKLGGKGDLTGSGAVLWTTQRGTSYTPSPVLFEGKLYMLTDSGMLSCLDARTGEPHYRQQRLPKPYNFKASPVAANGKLYLASENEDVIVVRMGPRYEVLATNTMADQTFIATPAIVDGTIYLRSTQNLYCVRG